MGGGAMGTLGDSLESPVAIAAIQNPQFAPTQAVKLARELFGVIGSVQQLPSERDQNFLVEGESGERFVLKIASASDSREVLDAQNGAMEHVARRAPSIRCPRPCPALSGDHLTTASGPQGQDHFVRMLTYVPGTPLVRVGPHTPRLLHSLGRLLGRLDGAFQGFSHPGARRDLYWDLQRAGVIVGGHLEHIEDGQRRAIVEQFHSRFEADVVPALPELRASVIHNDGNDYNALVDDGGAGVRSVVGIVDFGDMVESRTVFELAVGAAYALLDKPDPVAAAAHVVRGYHESFPLTEVEQELLFELICMRLCLSVTVSAYRKKHDASNEYLLISEKPAWDALEKLARTPRRQARDEFRSSCRMPAMSMSTTGLSVPEILQARDRHFGRGLSVHYEQPLKVVRGSMQYLYDETGREYLDAVNNVCHVGHCHPRVVHAAQEQIALLNTNTRYLYDSLVQYVERLCGAFPEPLSVCYLVCSGSEANDLALRLARAHTNRTDVVVVDGAYHGNTSALVEISPYKYKGPGGAGAPPHVHEVIMPDRYRGPYKDEDGAGEAFAQHVQDAIGQAHGAGRAVGAFLCEPLMGPAGQIVLPKNYLKAAYAHVREAGGVCVADEVQVGFGRVGTHFWAFETQEVVPDIVTLGKPIGNGHPMAAVITTPEIAASFDTGMEYFNTFGGNPVSCAVGLAVLDVIEEDGLQANALAVGGRLKSRLAALMAQHAAIGDVRGLGLFLGVELVVDRETQEPAADLAARVIEGMKDRGVLIGTDGPLCNVLKIKPPMVFSEANADFLVAMLDQVLAEVSGARA